jgi:putative transposase
MRPIHGPGRPPRLPGYDYSLGGCYFVTICIEKRRCILGRVVDGRMEPSEAGEAVRQAWEDLPHLHRDIGLDILVVMPNHVHGVLTLQDPGTHGDLGGIVRTFKSRSAVAVNRILRRNGTVWQRGYYEHIIRNERAYRAICDYIERNPSEWLKDPYHHSG